MSKFAVPPVIVMAALLFGCGGDGDDASQGRGDSYSVEASTTMLTASPPITKSEFVARINEVCRDAWIRVAENFEKYSSTQNPKLSRGKRLEEAIRLPVLSGIDFYIFDSIRLLGAPRGEEQAIEEIIGPFQASVELGQKRRWRARSVGGIARQFTKFNRRAQRYGLDDCLVSEDHLRISQ